MVNITVDPAQYACCTYKGQMTNKVEAYDFTTKWLKENGYEYFDAAYYFEVYDEKTNLPDSTSDNNTIKINCPVKKIDN
jgi:predicted transcriptional regulator YdeE